MTDSERIDALEKKVRELLEITTTITAAVSQFMPMTVDLRINGTVRSVVILGAPEVKRQPLQVLDRSGLGS